MSMIHDRLVDERGVGILTIHSLWDQVTDEWKSHANMIDARSQMGCLVLGDHLYVIGGTNRHNEVLRSVERFSFKHGKYSKRGLDA